jgi:hypothetical protein
VLALDVERNPLRRLIELVKELLEFFCRNQGTGGSADQ